MQLPPYTIRSASFVALAFAVAATAIHTGMIMDVGGTGIYRVPAAAVAPAQSAAPGGSVQLPSAGER